uniref:Tudor domain-containing protein n=1 Tax=Fagus sylvatica TaxID=28930 RepID=A0A2N9GDE4_FAGSY
MGRRAVIESAAETEGTTDEPNGNVSAESRAPLTSAQRLAVSAASSAEVVEVVSGDCITVADDSVPYGSPSAERRVNLSSIRCPKIGNPRRDEKPAPYAREAREFLKNTTYWPTREEVSNGAAVEESKQKEVLKVIVTEVLGGSKFYVQTVGDQKVASIQQQLASLSLQEAPVIGAFNPKKGDIVLAQFSADDSWNRAMIVNAPRGAVESPKDKFEVFYIDYGNQEVVQYSQLRPLESSVSSSLGLAQLCSLAYIKVPSLEEDFGQEAAEYLSEHILNSAKEFRAKVEERDTSGGKVKAQGTGATLVVTLVAVDAEISINAAILQNWNSQPVLQNYKLLHCHGNYHVKKFNNWSLSPELPNSTWKDLLEQKRGRSGITRTDSWPSIMRQYGDIQSDDEDTGPPVRKAGGGRR